MQLTMVKHIFEHNQRGLMWNENSRTQEGHSQIGGKS